MTGARGIRKHRSVWSGLMAAVLVASVASTLAGAGTSTQTLTPTTALAKTRSLAGKPLALRFGIGAPLPQGAKAVLQVVATGRSGSVVISSSANGPTVKRRLVAGRVTSIDVTALVRAGGTRFIRVRAIGRGLSISGAKRQPVLIISRPGIDPPPAPPADKTPPSAPGALAATPTRNSLTLTWPVATDDRGSISGYRLTLNGGPVLSLTAASYVASALDCQTSYAFAVTAVDAAGNVGPPSVQTFTTSSCPTIAAVGDIGCDSSDVNYNGGAGNANGCRQRYVSQSIVAANPDAFLMLGDAQYAQWGPAATSGSYTTEFGPLLSKTWAVQGNHDFDTGAGTPGATATAAGFFSYFGTRAGPGGFQPYSFDLGTWHFVVLNSNCTVTAVNCAGELTWLQNDLAQTKQPCIGAAWHHPRWVSAGAGEGPTYADNPVSAPWIAALYAKGADVVLNGHSHHYERSIPIDPNKVRDDAKGLRIFVSGTGGEEIRPATGPFSSSTDLASINNTAFGFLKMTLKARSFDYEFVRESGGAFTDSAQSVACHPKS